MVITNNYGFSLLSAGQAQKEVTVNTALTVMDALTNAAVASRTTTTPPTGVEGMLYIVAAASTGAWAGQDGKVAHYINGAWAFYTPKDGWSFTVTDESNAVIYYYSAAWSALTIGSGQRTDTATAITILATDNTVYCNPAGAATVELPLETGLGKFTVFNKSAFALTVSAPLTPTVTGLVAGYHLNSDVTDYSGNGLNGTPTGITYDTTTQHLGSAAAIFDGATSQISVADSPLLAFGTGAFTVYAWVRKTTTGLNEALMGKAPDSTSGVWIRLSNADNTLSFLTSSGTFDNLISTTTITDTNWHCVVFKRDASGNKTIKIDDTLDASTGNDSSANVTNTQPLLIGNNYAGQIPTSSIDEIVFFNVATTDAADTAFYNAGAGIELTGGVRPNVNGAATHSLPAQYDKATYQSDGTNYFVVG